MYSNRENYLIAANNYGLVAAGTKLYNTDGSVNILPGQLGIFNSKTHIAVNTFINPTDVYLAVGYDTNGDGVAEEVRKSAGDFKGCNSIVASAEPPRGGCPEIWDFLFDCTTCEAEYGIKVQVESTRQAPYFADQHLPTYPFNVITDCCGCETCTTDHNCNEIVCKIIDQINQTNSDSQSLLVKREFDFIVERLYPTISHLTLPCVSGSCGTSALCKLNSVELEYNSTTYTINTTVVNPNDPNTMLPGQVKLLENQLNAGLVTNNIPGKFHVIQKCTDSCFEITLNSCATIEDYDFEGTCTGVALTTEQPLTVSVPTNCTDCGDGGTTTKEYSCGIRFIGKIFPQECGCFPPAEYIRNRGTRLRVFPTTGFDCNNWTVVQKQDLVLEEGKGVDLRWREYTQEIGGPGRAYAPQLAQLPPYGAQYGRIPSALTAKCTDYCQYSFQHNIYSNNEYGTGQTYYSKLHTIVAIPSTDTTTRSAFEGAINSWIGSLNCPISTITCSTDQDKAKG